MAVGALVEGREVRGMGIKVRLRVPAHIGSLYLREIIVDAPTSEDIAELGSIDLSTVDRDKDGRLTGKQDRALAMRWLETLTGFDADIIGKLPLSEFRPILAALRVQLQWARENLVKKD